MLEYAIVFAGGFVAGAVFYKWLPVIKANPLYIKITALFAKD